jgi:signal transduction histidine kinase
MKSIRRGLTLGLLAGFSLLLGGSGTVIYVLLRGTLLEQFDSALLGKAMAMAGAIKQEGDKLEIEFRDNTRPELGGTNVVEFYEVCVLEGSTLRKSRSLGKASLPRELGPAEAPRFFDLKLPDDLVGRAVGLRFVPRWDKRPSRSGKPERGPPELGLVLAHDRSKLDRSLRSLEFYVLGTGVLTLLAAVILVPLLLGRGLAPLHRLAAQAADIHAGSLRQRFPAAGLPDELNPICAGLNDLLARLEHSFNDISEYSAKVAHELRTPLTILRLKVEQAGGRLPPDLAEELQTQLQHLAHVVEQSLLIARAEQGRLAVQPRSFDLTALVADLAQDFSLLAQENGRAVHVSSGPACFALADPKYARQIIHNLLSNALKHGRGDIHVNVTAHSGQCEAVITNDVAREVVPSEETLGLGLRVVETLLSLHPGMTCERRRGKHDYCVRLVFPAGESDAALHVLPASPGLPA